MKDIGFMVKVKDTESDCEYLAGCYNEGREVLLELFDHAVDEHLSECR